MRLGPSLLQVNGLKGLFIVEAVMRLLLTKIIWREAKVFQENHVYCVVSE